MVFLGIPLPICLRLAVWCGCEELRLALLMAVSRLCSSLFSGELLPTFALLLVSRVYARSSDVSFGSNHVVATHCFALRSPRGGTGGARDHCSYEKA